MYLRVVKKISKIIPINNFCNRDKKQNQDLKNSIEMAIIIINIDSDSPRK